MTQKTDEITALKAHEALPMHRVAQLRSAGMHAIRFEFVVRLLRAEMRTDTLSIYWDHDADALLQRKAGEATWRLVLGRGRRVSAEFPDLWVLCYPEDPETKQRVEAEIDGFIARVRAQSTECTPSRGFWSPLRREAAVTPSPEGREPGA